MYEALKRPSALWQAQPSLAPGQLAGALTRLQWGVSAKAVGNALRGGAAALGTALMLHDGMLWAGLAPCLPRGPSMAQQAACWGTTMRHHDGPRASLFVGRAGPPICPATGCVCGMHAVQRKDCCVVLQGVAAFLAGNLLQWHSHQLLAGLAPKAGAAAKPAYKVPQGGTVLTCRVLTVCDFEE